MLLSGNSVILLPIVAGTLAAMYMLSRRVDHKLLQGDPGQVSLLVRGKDIYDSKIYHRNIKCLEDSGYRVNQSRHTDIHYNWGVAAIIHPKGVENISKDAFIKDCKRCNVYSLVNYSYDTFFGNEAQYTEKLEWGSKNIISKPDLS
ncbi:MAG: hypothetical protein EBT86_05045 [Actinobacteria bacterium]|nr:hypothetical protein [Actinomycetota bacterium]